MLKNSTAIMDVDKTAINKIVVLNVTTENTITIHVQWTISAVNILHSHWHCSIIAHWQHTSLATWL